MIQGLEMKVLENHSSKSPRSFTRKMFNIVHVLRHQNLVRKVKHRNQKELDQSQLMSNMLGNLKTLLKGANPQNSQWAVTKDMKLRDQSLSKGRILVLQLRLLIAPVMMLWSLDTKVSQVSMVLINQLSLKVLVSLRLFQTHRLLWIQKICSNRGWNHLHYLLKVINKRLKVQ